MALRIASIVGSLRRDSLNRRLHDALLRLAPADLSFHDVPIGHLPLYNQDEEADPAEPVRRLKRPIAEADGVLFVTPEYNRSIRGSEERARPWIAPAGGERVGGAAGRHHRGVAGQDRHGAGAAAPAQHPGLSRYADAGAAGGVHPVERRDAGCGRHDRRWQSCVPARLDGPLCRLGAAARGLSDAACAGKGHRPRRRPLRSRCAIRRRGWRR